MKTNIETRVNNETLTVIIDGKTPTADITAMLEHVLDKLSTVEDGQTRCKMFIAETNKALKNNAIAEVINTMNTESVSIWSVLARKNTFGKYSISFKDGLYLLESYTRVIDKVSKDEARPVFIQYEDITKYVTAYNKKAEAEERKPITIHALDNEFLHKVRFLAKCTDNTLSEYDGRYFTVMAEKDADYKAFAKHYADRDSKTAKAEILQVFYNFFSKQTGLEAKALPFIWELVKLSTLKYKSVTKHLTNKRENVYINALFNEFINSNEKLVLKHTAKNALSKKEIKKLEVKTEAPEAPEAETPEALDKTAIYAKYGIEADSIADEWITDKVANGATLETACKTFLTIANV